MGLIDLRTDLKSLRYGNDQRGGGSSNQPYVTTPIPEGFVPTSADFLLRNGYLNPVNSFQDVKRLSKFFTDTKTSNGLLFTIKQELLERQNPKLVNINRIYNPLGTLNQAGLNSLGFHVNKQGKNPSEPSYFSGGTYGYYYATKGLGENPNSQFLQGEGYENRLTIAYTAKIEKKSLGTLAINPFGITTLSGDNILLSYPGGPNAPLGLGITNIRIQNPTRTVDLPKSKTVFSLRYGGDNIANPTYLTYIGAPTVNWVYNWRLGGVSDILKNNYPDVTGGVDIPLILNRDTSVNKPKKYDRNTFYLNSKGLKTSEDYLVPIGVRSSNIKWVYNPRINNPGVSSAAISEYNLEENQTVFFPNNSVTDILNRNTFINKPINREANTFDHGLDRSFTLFPTLYLRPSRVISSNINWVYQPVPSSAVSDTSLYEKLQINSDITPGYLSREEANTFSKTLLTRKGASGKDAPKTILPSKFILKHDNIFETGKYKGAEGLFNSDKLIKASTEWAKETKQGIANILGDNLLQNIPKIQVFDDDTKTIKQKGTTTLASLNPHYNIQKDGKDVEAPYPSIKTFNREDTYGTSITVYKKDYTKLSNKSYSTDTIQEQYVLRSPNDNANIEIYKNKDLIRFFFEINNNNAVTNTSNFWLFFRAYLNDFSDSYEAEWDSYKYVGRAESFYKYAGFSRDIRLSFTVYAHSRAEMKPIYQKLNYLAGITAPDYSEAGYMRGNFVNITVGNYLNSVPCIIKSVDLDISLDAGWDLNRDDNGNIITPTTLTGSDDVGQLPRMIDVNLSITPLHSFTPRFQSAFINTPFDDPQATI